jgi:hypothetical protein
MAIKWMRRQEGVAAALVIVTMALTAGLVAVAAPQLSFSHTNVSDSQDLSRYPDVAASADGYWAVVGWVEGLSGDEVRLGGNWGDAFTAFSGGASERIQRVAIDVTAAGEARVAYVVLHDGLSDVRYGTCDLSSGTCEDGPSVSTASEDRIRSVDLALDGGDVPHVVWDTAADDVWYSAYDGGGWSAPSQLDSQSMDSEDPAVACDGEDVHVVWEDTTSEEIRYRQRSSGVWDATRKAIHQKTTKGPPGDPDVAVGAGRVFATWQWCIDASCDEYNLVYSRSNDDGASWYPLAEVGTDGVVPSSFLLYASTYTDHRSGLRPAIALNDDGWPAIVWHAQDGAPYAVHYAYAQSGNDTNRVYWDGSTPAVLNSSAAFATVDVEGVASGGEPFMHVAYMDTLDVYYASNGERPAPPGTVVVDFSTGAYSVGEAAGSATITVTLSKASDDTVTVDWATSDGTATAGEDYVADGDTLTFDPGDTEETFSVDVTSDEESEGDETVVLTLSNAGGATIGPISLATLTIEDDDEPPPTVDFSEESYSVSEGAGTATITVILSREPDAPVTVDWATSDGTATAGEDYVAASDTLTFDVGETEGTFSVDITPDEETEEDETIVLTLSDASGATIGPISPATLVIEDDDELTPTVDFSQEAYSVSESAGTAVITVTLNRELDHAVIVDCSTSEGTATAGEDYVDAIDTLIFEVGDTERTFPVYITSDEETEGDETVILTLSDVSGASIGPNSPATLTIEDDFLNFLPLVIRRS